MKNSNLLLNNKSIKIGKLIGKGGEGEVYLMSDNPSVAIKLFTGKYDIQKIEKIKAIISLNLASQSPLVAYPDNLITSNDGRIIGFSMKCIIGHKAIHELYGVKSRKLNFPKADFKFLVRVAANTARAIAQVHSSGCVIGDINHSGILVSNNATVVLIDADSFQINYSGSIFPCVVGVPDFTPPELQRKSLRNITRTPDHDNFGLAVLIFQLLFMGKHPYAGKSFKSDFSLAEMIEKNLFAYSKQNSNLVSPPPGAPVLDNLPSYIQNAFEGAFLSKNQSRPTASEWINLLVELESNLRKCQSNNLHLYPISSNHCPWCKMEMSSGVVLFIEDFLNTARENITGLNLDIEKIINNFNQLKASSLSVEMPKANIVFPAESYFAKNYKKKSNWISYGTKISYLSLVILYFAISIPFIPIVGCAYLVYLVSNKLSGNDEKWINQYKNILQQYENYIRGWKSRISFNELVGIESSLKGLISSFNQLKPARDQKLNQLKNNHREKQLEKFLDNYLIKNSTIQNIGQSRKVTLASYGIETAADINYNKITSIPGFGDVMASNLVSWKDEVARKFHYNPAVTQSDKDDQNKIEAEYLSKSNSLKKQINDSFQKYEQLYNRVKSIQLSIDPRFQELLDQKMQLEVDMKYLGISIPAIHVNQPNKSISNSSSSIFSKNINIPTSINTTPNCPYCSSLMIQRVAKRGVRRGNRFWGCPRYPSCKGTRII
jgi:DNA-binding helix-hairpin-helix protein with protein kinase domain